MPKSHSLLNDLVNYGEVQTMRLNSNSLVWAGKAKYLLSLSETIQKLGHFVREFKTNGHGVKGND